MATLTFYLGQTIINTTPGAVIVGGSYYCSTNTITSGALPPGMYTGLYLNPPGFFGSQWPTAIGVAGALGTYPCAVTTNGVPPGPWANTWQINLKSWAGGPGGLCPLISLSAISTAMQVGVPYSATVTTDVGAAPFVWDLADGTLPTGLSLSAGGVVSGTPTVAGSFTFMLRATDVNACPGVRIYTVFVCPTITITPVSPLPGGTPGNAYSQTLSASGGTAPYTWSVVSGTLPTGLALSSGGALTGTPTVPAAYAFTVQATDANGCAGTKAYALTVACPTITITPVSPLPHGAAGHAYSQTLSASGGTAPYTWSVVAGALPPGLTLSSDGAVTGTPTVPAVYAFTVQAIDANGCAGTLAFTIQIYGPPVITTTSLPDGFIGTPYNQTVSATSGLAPYTFSVVSGALPAGLSLGSGGGITGTPSGPHALASFTVRVTDTLSQTDDQALTIQIIGPPVIVTTSLPTATQGAPYNQTVVAIEGVPPYAFTVLSGSLPTGLSLGTSGAITGTPSVQALASFTVRVTDAILQTDDQPLTILTVGPPTITTTSLPNAQAHVPYSQTVVAIQGTLPYTFTVLSGDLPMGLTLASSGVLSGTPTAPPGAFLFIVRVTDALSFTDDQALTITLLGPVVITTTSLPGATSGTAYSAMVEAAFGVPPYVFSLVGGAFPAGLSLASSGAVTGTPVAIGVLSPTSLPDAGYGVPYSAQLFVVNTEASSVVRVRVTDALTDTDEREFTVTLTGIGPYVYTLVSGALPTNLTLASSGLISGTPPPPPLPPVMAPASLPPGVVDQVYTQPLTVTGTSESFTFTVRASIGTVAVPDGVYTVLLTSWASGSVSWVTVSPPTMALPKCIALGSSTGVLGGRPMQVATTTVTVRATDAFGHVVEQIYTLVATS